MSIIELAAIAWWERKRPAQWSAAEHFQAPCVNCRGPEEFELAVAIANEMRADGMNHEIKG